VEAANLIGSMCGAPRGDVGRRGRPLPAREVRTPAPRPPPPLLEPSTGSEVQKPPEGGAPSGGTKETTPSKQYTRQTPVHRKDLVRDRSCVAGTKILLGTAWGNGQILTFASAE